MNLPYRGTVEGASKEVAITKIDHTTFTLALKEEQEDKF
jgi:hypothetical protein